MKALFWIGMVALILGVISLFAPIPHREREGIKVGGLSLGVETRHEERVSPVVSAVMIVGGASLMAAGRLKR
jgi:hypothetical protein